MKKFWLLLLTVICMMGLAGCAEKKESSPEKTTNVSKEEVYKEKKIEYPGKNVFYCEYDEDNTPVVYLFDTENYTNEHAAYKKYKYVDDEWEEEPIDSINEVLKEEKITTLYSLESAPDKNYYGIATDVSQGESGEMKIKVFQFLDKSLKLCKDVMYEKDLKGQSCQFIGDDKVCVLFNDGSVHIKNLKTGKTEKDLGDDFTTVSVLGDMIYSMNKEHNKIVEVDCKNGQKGAEYKYELTNQGIAFCKDNEENVYACTERGIFMLENNEMKEVVPASVMSEGAISTSAHIEGVSVKDEVFYVTYLISGNNSREYRMVSYTKH